MRFEESDRREPRFGHGGDRLDRVRRHVQCSVRRDLDDLVVAEDVSVLRDVLLADQRGVVPGRPERVDDVLVVVVERPPAVGQAEHPVGVTTLAGQECRAAPRAHRRGAERLPEEHALIGQVLDVGCRYLVAVRLHPPTGVVGVHVEDVRRSHLVNYIDGDT
jgi:hypothetical protein